jgi:hypothetical protein
MKIQKRLLVPLIVVGCLIAGGGVLFQRMRTNEGAAKGTLTMLDASLLVYQEHLGAYPAKLANLKSDQGGGAFQMVTEELLSGHSPGYDILYEPRDANRDGRPDSYVLRAVPTTRWLTGRKAFVVDSSGARHTE